MSFNLKLQKLGKYIKRDNNFFLSAYEDYCRQIYHKNRDWKNIRWFWDTMYNATDKCTSL